MRFGHYLFACVFQEDAQLPSYKGSTFRGVFGHALKAVSCVLRRRSCDDCLLRSRCVYAFVFETACGDGDGQQDRRAAPRRRIVAPPHPYVIEPDDEDRTCYAAGDSFRFSLLLFGRANEYLPYFVYAFDQVGRTGIGRRRTAPQNPATGEERPPPRERRDQRRGAAFQLVEVRSADRTLYRAGDGRIQGDGGHLRDLVLAAATEPVRTVWIDLQTPLRLKHDNRLKAALPFHVLVRAMLRRASSLCRYHGDGEPALDYRGLVSRAAAVETTASSLRWFDWKRYSNRQDRSMLMGGLVGSVAYRGDLKEYLPLLRFCEQVHLGKQTAFGLGRIALKEARP